MLEEFYSLTHILQALSHTHTHTHKGTCSFMSPTKVLGVSFIQLIAKKKRKKKKRKRKKKRGGDPNFSNVESE